MPIGSDSSTLSRRATLRCVTSLSAGRRSCRPTFWRATPPTSVPPYQTSRKLPGRGRLHTTGDDIVLLLRKPTTPPTRSDKPNSVGRADCLLNDEPVRIYVPHLMRPWIMQACHSTASCHLGTTRTLRTLERFYWWIGMKVCTRWWRRHRLKPLGNPAADCQLANHFHDPTGKPRVSLSVLNTSAPFRSRHAATPTSCSPPIASVVGPACSPSLPLSSPRRV